MKTIKKLMIVSMLCAHIVAVEQTPERFKECENVRSALIVSMKKYSKPSEDVLKKFPKCGQENSHHRRNGEDGTPLLHAAIYNSVEVVDAVLDSGVDIEEKNPNIHDGTALHAASCGAVKNVNRLLACGANPNSRDNNMYTPAHKVASLGYPEVLKILHEHGADLNAQDKWGYTLLHRSLTSCSGCAEKKTQYLIDQKVDLNIKDKYGNTALRNAIDYMISHGNGSEYQDLIDVNRESIRRLALAGADHSDFTDEEEAELFKILRELELKQERQEKLVREIEELIE